MEIVSPFEGAPLTFESKGQLEDVVKVRITTKRGGMRFLLNVIEYGNGILRRKWNEVHTTIIQIVGGRFIIQQRYGGDAQVALSEW